VVLIPAAVIDGQADDASAPADDAPIEEAAAAAARPIDTSLVEQSGAVVSAPSSLPEERHAAVVVMSPPNGAAPAARRAAPLGPSDSTAPAPTTAPAVELTVALSGEPAAKPAAEQGFVFGLPRRQRKQPENETTPAAEAPALTPRSAEAVSARMTAFQQGSLAARRRGPATDGQHEVAATANLTTPATPPCTSGTPAAPVE
jgi:hypothetical protein